MLDEKKIKQVVRSGMDEITFSVDGPDQETYSRYRQKGDFEKVLNIMSAFVEERNEWGREVPFINWRYILFKWNDSNSKMRRAKKLAEKIGIDRLTWEITDHPEEAKSAKYQIGTKHWKKIYYEVWDTNQVGNALRNKRLTARLNVLSKHIHMKAAGEPVNVDVKIKNTGGAVWLKTTWSNRRFVRLGAQLYDKNRNLLDLNYARAFLNRHLPAKEKEVLTITLPPLSEPGDYFLKFDMVSEGIDWFEAGGSPVAWKAFTVSLKHG
jgi:hypothetical protein